MSLNPGLLRILYFGVDNCEGSAISSFSVMLEVNPVATGGFIVYKTMDDVWKILSGLVENRN